MSWWFSGAFVPSSGFGIGRFCLSSWHRGTVPAPISRPRRPFWWLLLLLPWLTACASPRIVPAGTVQTLPQLQQNDAIMPDGYRLPLRVWGPQEHPRVVVLGLHGFNDYSKAMVPLGEALARQGITTWAVDQRGFGRSAGAGRWHGSRAMVADVHVLVGLLRARYPQARLYVAGESMGGAVAMVAASREPLPIDGLILIAPAIWSRDLMPWYQNALLQTAVHTVPGMELTGKGIRISPTDNILALRDRARDPLVIKATRVDALWGVTNLMDQAHWAARHLDLPVLWLYGQHDEIIPWHAFCSVARELPRPNPRLHLVLYHAGWHMLTRDRQGQRVCRDIAAWLADPQAPRLSYEAVGLGDARLRDFCVRPD